MNRNTLLALQPCVLGFSLDPVGPSDPDRPTEGTQAASQVCSAYSMTNGGSKTTLTNNNLLKRQRCSNCCVIHQDDFFKVVSSGQGQGREVAREGASGQQTPWGALGPR